jgi:penicillin-binding protein 2
VFTGFSTDDARPYVVTAYLEKAGYGSQAAAPVVKCTFMALGDETRLRPVELSEQLDLNATVSAPPLLLNEVERASCQRSKLGDGVRTQSRDVE